MGASWRGERHTQDTPQPLCKQEIQNLGLNRTAPRSEHSWMNLDSECLQIPPISLAVIQPSDKLFCNKVLGRWTCSPSSLP